MTYPAETLIDSADVCVKGGPESLMDRLQQLFPAASLTAVEEELPTVQMSLPPNPAHVLFTLHKNTEDSYVFLWCCLLAGKEKCKTDSEEEEFNVLAQESMNELMAYVKSRVFEKK